MGRVKKFERKAGCEVPKTGPSRARSTPGDLARRLDSLGPAYAAIGARLQEHAIDSTFLASLSEREAEETLLDLGATDRLLKRRVASELGLHIT